MPRDYLPQAYGAADPRVGKLSDLSGLVDQVTVVRNAVIENLQVQDQNIALYINGVASPIVVPGARRMTFDKEDVSFADYLRRVVEKGDRFDFVLDPRLAPQVAYFWIHIDYMDEPLRGQRFSRKEDGLFAMRTKGGEKAQRRVAREMVKLGHEYPQGATESPGCFQIWYADKKVRRPDLTCRKCSLRVEVKSHYSSRDLRISHSDARPFERENRPEDWHAFVLPDSRIHFVSNRAILGAMQAGRFAARSDRYDGWADLDPDAVPEERPPGCR